MEVNRTRILVLTHHAVKGVRGEYEYNLCKHLEEKGVDIHDVALFGDNSHYCRQAALADRPLGLLPVRVGEIFSPDMIREMKNGYDVIHLQGAFWSFIPLQAIVWKKLVDIETPMVMTTHAYIPEKQMVFSKAFATAVKKKDVKFLFYGIRCLPYRRLDKIFCQSDLERKFVVNEFGIDENKTVTIPNGVDIRRYRMPSYDFKELHKLKRKFMLLYVGQLIPMKGISYLLRAVKLLKSRGIDCDLALVSYNPRDDVIGEANSLGIEDNVRIYTRLPEEDLIAAYKSCDVFVLPSLSEGLPTVLLEAMAARKPVVSTNVSGVPNLLQDEVNGLMVNPRDPEALANNIEKLLLNEKLYLNIAENGYQTVVNGYTWDAVVDKIIEEYKNLAMR